MEDKIIEAIVTDEELFLYIERLVRKRLPQGPKLKSEVMWYKQVVDYSINQAFEDLQIVDILNYQISQLGKYLKKKQQQERQQLNDDAVEDIFVIEQNDRDETIQSNIRQFVDESTEQQPMLVSDAYGDETHHIRQPQYSDSEPTLQTAGSRRRKCSSSNTTTTTTTDWNQTPSSSSSSSSSSSRGTPAIPSSTTTTTPLSTQTSAVIDMTSSTATTTYRIHNEEEEENEEIENAKLQRALEIAKRYNIISDSSEVVASVPSTHPIGFIDTNTDSDRILSSDGRMTNALTMMDIGNESSPLPLSTMQHTDTERGSFSPATSPVLGTNGSPDRSPGGVIDLGATMRIGRAGDRYFPILRESDQSLDIMQSTDDGSGVMKGSTNHDDNDNDDNDEMNRAYREGQSRQMSPHGSLPPLIRQDSVFGTITSLSADGLTDSSGNRGLLSDGLVDTANTETELPEDQDNDNDDMYEADFETTSDTSSSPGKPNNTLSSSSNQNNPSSSSGPFANWSLPNDYIPRVRFVDNMVSDVFFVREKYARHEVPDLFYTHDESLKFTSDYNRESMKAEALGLTWYEWWENRTDEDVAKDDEEEETHWPDDDDSIEITDDFSDDDDAFNF